MKTLESLLHEANVKRDLWHSIAHDKRALADRGKTKDEALAVLNYFEGRSDALSDCIALNERQHSNT